ncbi:MAG: O-methyltransferase [Defluviitaleaceae bacterium]|nr:O-methyltransferase [Defluviitaleaceae bacterium]
MINSLKSEEETIIEFSNFHKQNGAVTSLKNFAQWGYKENYPIITEPIANVLSKILDIHKPENILEIGLCIGYSASFMASKPYVSKVTSIDRAEKFIKIARENIESLNLTKKIEIIYADAAYELQNQVSENKKYDLIFLDAAKAQYINFLPFILKLLKKGGILLADNISQKGLLELSYDKIEKRQRTIYNNMKKFITAINIEPSLHSTIAEIGDGLSVSIKN